MTRSILGLIGFLMITSVALAQPVNDECASATDIFDGVNFVTTTTATFSGTESSCPVPVGGVPVLMNPDTWYSYTAVCTGDVTLDMISLFPSDTIFAVYDDCTLSTEVVCAFDPDPTDTFPTVAGEDYLIRVFAWDDFEGDADLIITCIPALSPNDECVDAAPLLDGANIVSTAGASFSGIESSCPVPDMGFPALANPDVFFDYTASCTGDATFSVTNIGLSDLIFTVYTDCTLTTELVCEDGFGSFATLPVVSGQSYVVRVFGFNGNQGSATLDVSCVGSPSPFFIRGDLTENGTYELQDAITLLALLFSNGAAPNCLDTADIDGNGALGLPDAISLLTFLFLNGPSPAAPSSGCGAQPVGTPSVGCLLSNDNC